MSPRPSYPSVFFRHGHSRMLLPVGSFPCYADLFVSDRIHVGIRLIVRSVRSRSVVSSFGSIDSFRTRLVPCSITCRSFCFVFVRLGWIFPFVSIRSVIPHQYSPWSCCFLQMVFAQQLPGLLRSFHDRRTTPPTCTDVKDERLETSSFCVASIRERKGWRWIQPDSSPPSRQKENRWDMSQGERSIPSRCEEREWIPSNRWGNRPEENPTWRGKRNDSPPPWKTNVVAPNQGTSARCKRSGCIRRY